MPNQIVAITAGFVFGRCHDIRRTAGGGATETRRGARCGAAATLWKWAASAANRTKRERVGIRSNPTARSAQGWL